MGKTLALSLAAAALAIGGAGCATYKDQAKSMTGDWTMGHPTEAAAKFSAKAEKAKNSKDAVVWDLEAATAQRMAGDYEASNRYFDAAVERIDRYEEQAKVKAGREAAAIMSNQQNLPYEGRSYDKIMLHTYKALNFMAQGDLEKARPEIIRAYQRQQDAVEENKRRIEAAREAEEKDAEKAKVEQARQNPKFQEAVTSVTQPLEGFKFYADYVNPFTVYLDGLNFLYAGAGRSDLERAEKSFKRVVEVAGDSKYVQGDLQTVEAALNGKDPGPCTYVIFETGRAASFDQIRIDIPIVVAKVSYVGAAFPKLQFHPDYASSLTVKAGGVQETTQTIANMDAIVALDFRNEWPAILTKTLLSTTAKAVAGYAINEAASQQDALVGLFAKIATAATQAAMNIADTRSWTTLPKEFQVARVATPADRKLSLSASGNSPADVSLVDGVVNVVHVRAVTATSPLVINQFKLK